MGACMGNRHSSEEKESKKRGRPSETSSSNVHVAVNVEDKTNPSQSSPSDANTAGPPPSTQSSPPPPPSNAPPPAEPPQPKPPPQVKSGPSDPPLPSLADLRDDVQKLLTGDVANVQCTEMIKVIRIFVSACQADSELERTVLMERVFPKLQMHCAKNGFELQLVDLHWGHRLEDMDDHSLVGCSLFELKECQQKSIGPKFISFLNQKYNCQCPCQIPATAFKKLQESITDSTDKQILDEWYRIDTNAVPPEYVLQPISSQIKKYKDTNKDVRLQAEKEWNSVQDRIKKILTSCWSREEQERYMVSVMEKEIRSGPLETEASSDDIVWIRRVFKDIESSVGDSSNRSYIDTLGENNEIDEVIQDRLSQLRNELGAKINEGNFLKFEISWSKNGVDPEGISEHAQYIDSLCNQSEVMLTTLIDKAISDWQVHQDEAPVKKIHDRLYSELQQHTKYCQQLCNTFQGRQDLLSKVEKYLASDSQFPLIIHGLTGCGKTALVAKAAGRCYQVVKDCACIVRFVGATVETYSLGQLLRSVCEQVAYLYGNHISVGSKGVGRIRKELPLLLKKVQAKRPLVIIIDGIDELVRGDYDESDWIPPTLPPHVKMILSTSSDNFPGFSSLKSHLNQPSCFLEVPKMTSSEVGGLSQNILKSKTRKLSDGQSKVLQDAINNCPLPLYVQLASHMASRWHSYNISNETVLSNNIKDQINSFLTLLEKCQGVNAVQNMLSYLTASKHGLSDSEMLDLISCDETVLDEYCTHRQLSIRRAPAIIWTKLRKELAPFLNEHLVNGHLLRTWSHRVIRDAVMQRYLASESQKKKVHQFLANYFQGKWAGDKKPCPRGKGVEVSMDRHVQPQPLKFDKVYNTRKLEELPFHVFHSGDSKFMKNYIWDISWVCSKLDGSDVFQLLDDIALARTAEPDNTDLEMFQKVVQLSAYALYCDGNQVFSQIHTRLRSYLDGKDASLYPKLSQIVNQAQNPPITNFLPSGDCLVQLDEGDDDEVDEVTLDTRKDANKILNGFYRIKGDMTHMVSIATLKGEVKVWNIENQTTVRTLTGIDMPRDVRMIDDHRCVILCNRALKIFNLDTGTLETTLKGIMNLQMPYYGIQDRDHVVALARNRMYLNIINVSSGEVESTFKVGEDRFLNSLLVSENGERCVCGDETQKPSPLLVWDLNARKLLHDFRIAQHEFKTKMSAISKDGNYVVSVIKEVDDPAPNFVIVYDLISGQLFKKWKPVSNTCCVDISSEGECVVNGCEDNTILVWNLTSGALKHTLRGHTHPIDRIYMSEIGNRCLTYDSSQLDRSVRLWDLQNGVCLATFTTDVPISCCQINANGTSAVIGLDKLEGIITLRLRTSDSAPIPENNTIYGDAARMSTVFDLKK